MTKKEHLLKVRPTIEFDILSNILNDVLQAMENYTEEQLHIKRVNKSLPSNDLANWSIRNHWVFNFGDNKWWQLQESGNYINKTTVELAEICLEETTK